MVKAKITFLSLWSAVFLMSTWANSEEISWNGIYSGIHGGFAKSDVGWDEKIKYFLSDSETTYGARGSGFAGGVHIGINRQWNNGIVTGLEFSATGLNVRTSEPSPYVADDTFKTSMNHLLLGSARIGYTTGKFLFYADGGLAAGKISMENSITQKLPDKDDYYYVFSSEKWHPGYSLGSGVDYRATKNVSIGFNYRLVALQNKSHTGIGKANQAETPQAHHYTVDAQAHLFTLRLNWLFHQNSM